jgi:hypothetical protein
MSDERLRDRARASSGTGAPADEAAHLRERVRAGELPEAHVRWAAGCGHAAAALVTATGPTDLAALHAELTGEADIRCSLAILHAVHDALEDGVSREVLGAQRWCSERELFGLPTPTLWFDVYAQPHGALGVPLSLLLIRASRAERERPLFARIPPPSSIHGRLPPSVPADALRAALLAEWVPWLLGEGDPVRARVDAAPAPPRGGAISFHPRSGG